MIEPFALHVVKDHKAVDDLKQPWWSWNEPHTILGAWSQTSGWMGCIRIFRRALRLPQVVIEAGGIGGLFVRPEFRAQSIGPSLVETAIRMIKDELHLPAVVFFSRLMYYDVQPDYVQLKRVKKEWMYSRALVPGLLLHPSEDWRLDPEEHF